MSVAIRADFENERILAFGSVDLVAFTGIGTAFDHPARLVKLSNATDITLQFSNDGINGKFCLFPGESMIVDLSSNKTIEAGFYLEKTTRIFVRAHPNVAVLPSSGFISLSVIFGETGY